MNTLPSLPLRGAPGESRGASCHGGSRGRRVCVAPTGRGAADRPESRRGFTLVELLVVISIIALMMGLLTPAVMRSLAKARNAAIKAEIDMLHMAIMNYKNEYGSFPPAISDAGSPSLAATHVKRLFPRSVPIPLDRTPANSLVRWLRGYTTDPTDPLGTGRQKLFDFDTARVTADDLAHAPGRPGSPYIYIPSGQYATIDKVTGSPQGWPAADVTYTADGASRTIPAGTYFPHRVPTSAAATDPWHTQWSSPNTRPFFNPDTFQILCAGRDEQFGTDDDLSNFWPGTRREYLDSLR